MTRIATYELAARLPLLLARLAAGEEVLLTDAGRPVARVLPPMPHAVEPPLTSAEWRQELDAWQRDVQARANRYPPGFVVDCSCDAIYGEREDAPR